MIYKGSQKEGKVYIGGTKISKIYKGNTLLYSSGLPSGTVIFESSTPGTYTINITSSQTYYIELVGGGAGGNWMGDSGIFGGGAGGYISGTIYLSAGNYTLVIGNKGTNGYPFNPGTAGGDTTFYNQIAGGGKSRTTYAGGTCTITENTLTGVNGNNGGQRIRANSVYDNTISGYGAGGYGSTDSSNPAIAGYAKIVTA